MDTAIKVPASTSLSLQSSFQTWPSTDQSPTPRRWPEVTVKLQGHCTALLKVHLYVLKGGQLWWAEWGVNLLGICYMYFSGSGTNDSFQVKWQAGGQVGCWASGFLGDDGWAGSGEPDPKGAASWDRSPLLMSEHWREDADRMLDEVSRAG